MGEILGQVPRAVVREIRAVLLLGDGCLQASKSVVGGENSLQRSGRDRIGISGQR